MTAKATSAGDRIGRDGELRLRFECRAGRTVLAAQRSTLPLQALAPVALADPAAVVSMLNPTGGIVGGDRLRIDVTVEPGAHALLTTPSATKVYRAAGAPASQAVRLVVGAGATLEWLPDHLIPFPGSRLCQTIHVTLAPDARLVLVDAFAAGRVARGEAWQFASLESAVDIRHPSGRVFLDRLVLAGGVDAGARYAGLGVTEGHAYVATIVAVAPGDAAGYARSVMTTAPDVTMGAAPLARRGAVVRVIARTAPALLTAVDAAWAEARRQLLHLPPLDLRK